MNRVIHRSPFWAVCLLIGMLSLKTDSPADQLLGHWLFPSRGSSVDIYRVGDRYFARVAEVDEAGKKNYGLIKDRVLIRNLAYDGQVWTEGALVHPKTGMKLSCEVQMNDPQTITVTIYKGIKLLRRTFIMTRPIS